MSYGKPWRDEQEARLCVEVGFRGGPWRQTAAVLSSGLISNKDSLSLGLGSNTAWQTYVSTLVAK